jgi:hypothetical protein
MMIEQAQSQPSASPTRAALNTRASEDEMTKKAEYVKVGDEYFVQVLDQDSRWGFYLCDEDASWDGGFGIADNQQFEIVPENKVPLSVRERLGWIMEEHN